MKSNTRNNTIILPPTKPDWESFAQETKADEYFMQERMSVVSDEGRCLNIGLSVLTRQLLTKEFEVSWTNIKKNLEHKSQAELIKEIAELYKRFPQVKEYYEAQQGDPSVVLKKYQDIIQKEFVHGFSRGLPKARLSVARKAVTDFKKMTEHPVMQAELMLTFVESVSSFCTEFGVDEESFYVSAEGMFDDLLQLMAKNNLLALFQIRLSELVRQACDGWGHQDSLDSSYKDYFGKSAFFK